MDKVQLTLPNGEIQNVPLNFERGHWVTHYENTQEPGLYLLNRGEEEQAFSVHLPEKEGELSSLSDTQFKQVQEHLHFETLMAKEDFIQNLAAGMEHIEVWKYLLMVAMALLSLEGLLSWRFS